MKYNINLPLAFIHIPKTGGTSVRSIFENWYGTEHIIHCYDKNNMLRLQQECISKPNTVLYGHFNRVNPCIAELTQLITIIRKPIDSAISEYFHRKRTNRLINERNTLIKHIEFKKHNTLADRVSFEINTSNYKQIISDKFLYIGITENMYKTINNIANILNKPLLTQQGIPQLNIAPGYDDEIHTLTQKHIDNFNNVYKLDNLIYDYIAHQ